MTPADRIAQIDFDLALHRASIIKHRAKGRHHAILKLEGLINRLTGEREALIQRMDGDAA
ncbi:hypothetical protein ACFFUB_02505 [Algimonas porphyrae]|uniref:Uncharacterized protein n=1 Tax=Algimonas porphyrae TaxID=1128113 RepID=A0ABQ5V119_9PROT|nr:hypothetical protein [Algimonas porphyrae]GLQ20369.1 hypothetical protein GCM10007854_13240 [Algimonas porphyrae]